MGWIAFLVIALVLGAVPASAKKKDKGKAPRRYRLPVERRWMPDRKIVDAHHDYPAWDLAVPRRTVVDAVHAGRVRAVTRWGGCGRGVIIRGADGYEYTYCHGSGVSVKKWDWVKAGQRIMLSGNTGHSTGPHLHLQIKAPDGRLICPQPLLYKWARGKQVSPRRGTSRGCAYSPDRPIYRKHPPKHDRARSRRGPGRSKAKARAGQYKAKQKAKHKRRDRSRPGKGKAKRSAGKAKDRPRTKRKDHRKGKRGRKHKRHGDRAARKRAAERRRKARARAKARAARIRQETAVRRAELALARRVRPLV